MEREWAGFSGRVSLAAWIARTDPAYRTFRVVGSPSSARPVFVGRPFGPLNPVFVGLYSLRSLSLFLRSSVDPAFAGLFDPAAACPVYLACPFSGLFGLFDPDCFDPAVFAVAPASQGLRGAFW